MNLFRSNSFSKFLEHCLRFQPEVTTNAEIKKEMFYILNNNVEDVSVGGVFNLLDFIFNEYLFPHLESVRRKDLSIARSSCQKRRRKGN